jgi:hypothetical protein
MKKRDWMAVAVVFCAVLIALSGCSSAREKLTVETAWAKFAGTWENPSYAGPQPFTQKMVVKPDLTGEDWLHLDSPAKDATWLVKPIKFWTDSKGSLYFQYFNSYAEPFTASNVPTGTARVLMRLDRTGKTLEITGLFGGTQAGKYPENIDPTARVEYGSIYYIYHRKP